MRLILLGLFAAFSLTGHASVFQDEANQELATIKRVLSFAYAPATWKKQQFGWDLDTEYQKALNVVAQKSDLSMNDYRKISTNLLRSTKDYHVGISFFTTEKATLPFTVVGTQGRYFIMYIDRTKLSETQFPVSVGDELIEFGGKSAAEAVKEIKTTVDWSVEETDEALAQLYLTRRSARAGNEVPSGPIEIKVNHKDEATGDIKVKSVQLAWEYTPEYISWQNSMVTDANETSPGLFKKQMVWPGWKTMKQFEGDADGSDEPQKPAPNPFSIGLRNSWVPALGLKIWESDAAAKFHAYIYKSSEGKLIGYVRIPSYSASTAEFTEMKGLIKKFEATTDALVIDEVNNPGGSVLYVYALQSLLNPNTSFAPPHQIALYPQAIKEAADGLRDLATVKTDKDAQRAISEGSDNIDGYPVNYEFAQFALNFYRFILNEWKSGRTLSNPTYLWGVDRINQDRETAYTKPILVLVNSLCFSGGDFFPSMLQDNQRAKIFGTRTAGAGGWIDSVQFPSRLGMEEFSVTGSIAWRIGKEPIENLGVTPDTVYNLTPEDFMGGFAGYKKAVNDALTDMLKTK